MAVAVKNISKRFQNNLAPVLDDISLDIHDGEFLVLLGPSGCGKSTLLRIIAGLETQTSGDVYIDDICVNSTSPKDRDVAMVFQNYALYPHMSVFDNMAFGLKMRKMPKTAIQERVNDAAKSLELTALLKRKPKELSGGQRQRVALGRAIVRQPKAFLMDEPLSNLDAKLRAHTRLELERLHQELKTTTIYVTHDQIEAMTLGERVVVLNDGKIQQIGPPDEVYQYPTNIFVGQFMGQMALIPATLNGSQLEFAGEKAWALPEKIASTLKTAQNKALLLGIRPEHFVPINDCADKHIQPVTLKTELSESLGKEKLIYSQFTGTPITASLPPDALIESTTTLGLRLDRISYFDAETAQNYFTNN